jgi:calcineurin-like phosphoesterase family protein
MLYFISDTHFDHRKIIDLSARPFASVAEMNEAMIERWNAIVTPRDTVIHLGDFGLGTKDETTRAFRRLHGHKELVVGNHDKGAVLNQRWKARHHYLVQRWEGVKFVLSHFPMETWWHAYHPNVLHLHGHVHGGVVPKRPHRWDVGADPLRFTPISAEQLAVEGMLDASYQPEVHMHEGWDREGNLLDPRS